MKQEVLSGQTDYTVLVKIRDDAGAPATGLTEADIDIAYARVETDNDVTTTDVTPAALAALTTAHTDWGFEEVSATDHPGLYRLDIADAVFAAGAWSAVVTVTGTGLDPADLEFVMVPNAPLTGVLLAPVTHTSAVIPTVTTTGTATNVTTVNGLAANVITAASMAADASAEIADAVWDEDATGHQTGGTFGQAIGDPGADTNTIYGAVVTGAAGATIAADIVAVKAETATILADTNELQTDWVNGGRLDLLLDATLADTNELQTDWVNGGRLDLIIDAILVDTGTTLDGKIDTIDTNVDSILADTGTDGVVVAAGSKTGYTLSTAGLAAFFTSDSGETYADAVAGSIVAEIADNAGGSALTAAAIADAVWDEAIADHSGGAGSTAEQLAAAGAAGDPWATAIPGAYGAGTAGKIVGDNLNATVSSRATQTSVDDVPTNAELTTALAGADDAVLAAIAALNDFDPATEEVLANVQKINDVTIIGDGSATPFNV